MTSQTTVALSTTEVKFDGGRERGYAVTRVREHGLTREKTMVFCDNHSAIHLSKNQVDHEQTKHISIGYHIFRDFMSQVIFEVQKVSNT